MKRHTIGTGKMLITVFAAVVILIAAQSLALLAGNFSVMLGCPAATGNVIAGILYPVMVLAGSKLWVKRFLKQELQQYHIGRGKPRLVWCCSAVLMPCMAAVILCCFTGHWESPSLTASELAQIITGGIFFFGIGTGIAEEIVFRGLILHVIACRWNKWIGIFVLSVLFAVLHIAGTQMDFISILQLLVAGSVVGILFSLVTYESGSVWSSAVMHAMWNMIMIGGMLHIGDTADPSSVYNYVLETKAFLITGGDFGIEASVVSILAYSIFILLALALLYSGKRKRERASG
ncbi:MAG: CPBP family intramembrane metalloprotease [Clostridia bacterium]|nr:CPBP family intramembrane metalloprotease [Clostridia bacterium]